MVGLVGSLFLSPSSEVKAVKMFAITIGVYCLCFIVSAVVNLSTTRARHNILVDNAFILLTLVNSGANCFIYAWKNGDFKEAYKKILCHNPANNVFKMS